MSEFANHSRLGLLDDPLVQPGGIEEICHAVVQHVDDVDARITDRAGLELSARTSGGGADIGDFWRGASNARDGIVACARWCLGGHGNRERGSGLVVMTTSLGIHYDGFTAVIEISIKLARW